MTDRRLMFADRPDGDYSCKPRSIRETHPAFALLMFEQ